MGCWDCCCNIGLTEDPEKSGWNIRWSKAELGVAAPYGEVTELLLQGEPAKEPGSDFGPWCGNVLARCMNPGPGGPRVTAETSGWLCAALGCPGTDDGPCERFLLGCG